MKTKTAVINVNRGKGLNITFELPVVFETSIKGVVNGYVCRTGTGDTSPATEWFAKDSNNVKVLRVV